MRLKLDENLGPSIAAVYREAGYEASTVHSQERSGASDDELIEICRQEGRCLVTLDLDFANPFIFDPRKYAGIAVLRVHGRAGWDDVVTLSRTLVSALSRYEVAGRLWIVERGRVREYRPEDEE